MALEFVQSNIFIYISAGILYVFLVVFIYFFVQHKAQKLARRIIAESLESEGYQLEMAEKKEKIKIEKKLVDEIIFFIGLIISILGLLMKNYILLLIGLLVAVFSVFMLHFLLRSEKQFSMLKEPEDNAKPVKIIKSGTLEEIPAEEKRVLKEKLSAKKITVIKEKGQAEESGDEDKSNIGKFLSIVDELLEKIPEHEISAFAASKEFELYRKLMKEHPKDINELKKLAPVIDNLLGKLPKKEIAGFSKSKDFKLYKTVMSRLM